MKYRRRKHSDCWHFSENCRWWPKRGGFFSVAFRRGTSYFERTVKPKSGEFCNECIRRKKRGEQ